MEQDPFRNRVPGLEAEVASLTRDNHTLKEQKDNAVKKARKSSYSTLVFAVGVFLLTCVVHLVGSCSCGTDQTTPDHKCAVMCSKLSNSVLSHELVHPISGCGRLNKLICTCETRASGKVEFPIFRKEEMEKMSAAELLSHTDIDGKFAGDVPYVRYPKRARKK